jgi:hypothetical protein
LLHCGINLIALDWLKADAFEVFGGGVGQQIDHLHAGFSRAVERAFHELPPNGVAPMVWSHCD